MKTRQSKINVCRVLLMSLSMGLTSLCSADDAQPAWDKTPASKEINGMRRYSRGLVEAISAGMRQSEKQKYPGVRAFLDQSAKALAEIDPEKTPGEWPELDVDQLVTSNPAFWTACYEVAPGDPLMIWLHASYYGINGHVHQVLYTQSLAMRTSANEQVTKEMSRLVISASRVIGLCQQQVDRGIRTMMRKSFHRLRRSIVTSSAFAQRIPRHSTNSVLRCGRRAKALIPGHSFISIEHVNMIR